MTFNGQPGTIDLSGVMGQSGILPGTTSKGNVKHFTVTSLQGSGSLTLDQIDGSTNSARGSFTITQGEITIKGTFTADV